MRLASIQRLPFALMLGPLEHGGTECGLIGKVAMMAVEIAARPFGYGTSNPPAAGEIVPAVAGRDHRVGIFADQGDGQSIDAAAIRDLGEPKGFVVMDRGGERGHAGILPSTTSAAT